MLMARDSEAFVSIGARSPESRLRDDSRDWLSTFIEPLRTAGTRLLELGCGRLYADAEVLADLGLRVAACDLKLTDLPDHDGVHAFVADISRPLPVRSASVDVVLASLSLHYFPWSTTNAVVDEIHRVLRPSGLLLMRVNATDDVEHGAGVGEEIEPNYFDSGGEFGASRKRYFDEVAVRELLGARFALQQLRHVATYRFGPIKQVWECLAISASGSDD
jgi:SAM-dependent methyltransferase